VIVKTCEGQLRGDFHLFHATLMNLTRPPWGARNPV